MPDHALTLPCGHRLPNRLCKAAIEDIITRFAIAAGLLQQAGFDGVPVHAAHGYLLSQFLSPRTNQCQDQWGGTLQNGAALLEVSGGTYEQLEFMKVREPGEVCDSTRAREAMFLEYAKACHPTPTTARAARYWRICRRTWCGRLEEN